MELMEINLIFSMYFISNNGEKKGPFKLEELKGEVIKVDTLVWKHGFKDWKLASDIIELQQIIISNRVKRLKKEQSTPPDLPSKKTINKQSKFDLSYERESGATAFGIILIAVNVLLYFMIQHELLGGIEINKTLIVVAMLIRIIITVWIVRIAKRLNRDVALWGVFGLLLPPLALIIIGTRYKMKTVRKSHQLTQEQIEIIKKRKMRDRRR